MLHLKVGEGPLGPTNQRLLAAVGRPPAMRWNTSQDPTQAPGQLQAQATQWLASTSLAEHTHSRGISFQLHMQPQQPKAIKEMRVQNKQLQCWLGLHRMVRDCHRLLKGPMHDKQAQHAGLLQTGIANKAQHLQPRWPHDSQGFSWIGLQKGLSQMLKGRRGLCHMGRSGHQKRGKASTCLHKTG